jgi:hypothetical protein
MLGFYRAVDAKAAYVRQYDRPGFFQSMEEHDMATFKQMLKDRRGMKLKKSLGLEKSKYLRKYKKNGKWIYVYQESKDKTRAVVEEKRTGVKKEKTQTAKGIDIKRISNGIKKAIKENPERLKHGYTAKNAFWILETGEVVPFKDKDIMNRRNVINVHSHSPENWEKAPKGNFQSFSGADMVALQHMLKYGYGDTIAVIVAEGQMDIFKGSDKLRHKNKKYLEFERELSPKVMDEIQKKYKMKTKDREINIYRMVLKEIARETGSTYLEKINWKSGALEKAKYIRKYWKNGRWNYTYPENGGRRPKPMPEFKVRQNLGGTTGGVFLVSMANGERKVMKRSTNPKHLLEEYTANRIYKILGVAVPNVNLYGTDKGVAQVSDFIEGTPLSEVGMPERADAIESLKQGFVADALLGNWDVLGLDEDNILWDGSKAWRIDNGGVMRYRAQGAPKGDAFGGTVGEIETMRDPDRQAGRMFNGISETDIADQVRNIMVHRQAILQAIEDPRLRQTMEARIGSLEGHLIPTKKSKTWHLQDMTLLKSTTGKWFLYENKKYIRFWWFHGLEKAIKTKTYYSPEEVKARGMRWVTIRGARVLVQGTSDGGWVVVGGAGGKLNHLRIDKLLSTEEYAGRRKKVEEKRKEELRTLSKEELAEQVVQRRAEVKAKRAVRAQYTQKVTEVLGVTQEEIRSEITAKQMDELADKARIMVEGRASSKTLDTGAIDKEVDKQTEKEIEKAIQRRVKSVERQALETLMNDYMPGDPNAKPELKKLLDPAKALEVLAARKAFRKEMRDIGKGAADIPTNLKVGDIFAAASKEDYAAIEKEVKDQIETQKNIRLYDTLNAQSLTIQKHIDEGSISALNGLVGDLYGVGATFSSDTVEQLGLETIVRAVTIKLQQDGKGEVVQKALEEYAATEREKVVTAALKESEKRFKNAESLRSLARDTDDAEAILSMASANGHALKQLTGGQRALGTAVGSLRAVAHLINALKDPPADVVQADIGKDLTRARKKAKKAGLPKGSYSIKTLKEGKGKRLVLEFKKDQLNTFFQCNAEMRKEESEIDRIKMHKANNGYKPAGVKENIKFDAAQEAGLRFFKEQDRVILDFEAGIGKTGVAYAAIMEAMQNKGAKKILVVTPAKTRGDFKSQAGTFLEKDMQKLVRSSTENISRDERRARHEQEGIHIISQDSLREDASVIKAAGYDMIVVDEIHEMTAGSGQAGRFKALMGLTDIPLKIAMSGTNIKNKKNELYRKIDFVDPNHTLGSMAEFEKRYKGLNQGTGMFSDAANDAFRKEVAQWVYTQKNALPVKNNVESFRIPLTTNQRKRYAASERKYREDRERKVPGAAAQRDARNYGIITDGESMDNAKLNRMVKIIKENHSEEKAVIHISRPGVPVLAAMQTAERRLKTEFGENSVGTLHGESKPGYVTGLKKRFNNPDDPLRFIIGTKSLESGHNLQGGGTVTFHLDIPDSYASFEQRNARIFRKGQDRDTKSYVLSGMNPYDMRGEDILETKKKEQSILGNSREIESMDDTGFLGILNKYEKEAQSATA